MPFRIGDVAYDSSDAFAIAAEVQITLGHSGRYPAPVWYVLWGNEKSGFNAWVNSTTGTLTKAA